MNSDDPAAGFALIERIGADEYNRLVRELDRASIVATINGHEIWPVQRASADCMLSAERSGLSPRSRRRKRARGKLATRKSANDPNRTFWRCFGEEGIQLLRAMAI
jgi:hypothetical protein